MISVCKGFQNTIAKDKKRAALARAALFASQHFAEIEH